MSTVCLHCEKEEQQRRSDPVVTSRGGRWAMMAMLHEIQTHRESGCVEFINREAWQELQRCREEARSRKRSKKIFGLFSKIKNDF